MNTQAQVRNLEAGQALQVPGRIAGALVLAEGELLAQGPATWLADRLVVPAPVRIVAPAELDAAPGWTTVAVRASKVVFRQKAPLLSAAKLAAFFSWPKAPRHAAS